MMIALLVLAISSVILLSVLCSLAFKLHTSLSNLHILQSRLLERCGTQPDFRLTALVSDLVNRVNATSEMAFDAAMSAIDDYRQHKVNTAEKQEVKPSSSVTYNGGANTLTPFPVAEVRPQPVGYDDNVG